MSEAVQIRIPRKLDDQGGSIRMTIPIEIVRLLGLSGGQNVVLEVVGGTMVLTPEVSE